MFARHRHRLRAGEEIQDQDRLRHRHSVQRRGRDAAGRQTRQDGHAGITPAEVLKMATARQRRAARPVRPAQPLSRQARRRRGRRARRPAAGRRRPAREHRARRRPGEELRRHHEGRAGSTRTRCAEVGRLGMTSRHGPLPSTKAGDQAHESEQEAPCNAPSRSGDDRGRRL